MVTILDEIFCVWTQGPQKLNELFNCINNLHATIKFTRDYSTAGTNFLGVIVTKIANKLKAEVYTVNQTIGTSTFMHNHVTVMCIKDILLKTGCKV